MPEFLNDFSLAELTAPIADGSGEDLSFSTLFDQIKEARRADPDYLTLGDWQTDLKSADWDLTISLSAQGLAQQSKDLMLVAWLNEGLAQRYHFEGITFGLNLAEQILQSYWDTLYPSLEEGLDERGARLSWLKTSLTDIVGGCPLPKGNISVCFAMTNHATWKTSPCRIPRLCRWRWTKARSTPKSSSVPWY